MAAVSFYTKSLLVPIVRERESATEKYLMNREKRIKDFHINTLILGKQA